MFKCLAKLDDEEMGRTHGQRAHLLFSSPDWLPVSCFNDNDDLVCVDAPGFVISHKGEHPMKHFILFALAALTGCSDAQQTAAAEIIPAVPAPVPAPTAAPAAASGLTAAPTADPLLACQSGTFTSLERDPTTDATLPLFQFEGRCRHEVVIPVYVTCRGYDPRNGNDNVGTVSRPEWVVHGVIGDSRGKCEVRERKASMPNYSFNMGDVSLGDVAAPKAKPAKKATPATPAATDLDAALPAPDGPSTLPTSTRRP